MRWQCHPQKLFSAQAFPPKSGRPSWLPVLGLCKEVHPPPKVSSSGKSNSTPSLTDVFSSMKWAEAQVRNAKTLPEARRRKAPAGPAHLTSEQTPLLQALQGRSLSDQPLQFVPHAVLLGSLWAATCGRPGDGV